MTYQRYTLDKSITEVFKEHIPNKIIKERQQGKEKLSYVSGSVILDMINKATNYNWDFIVEERWIQESRDKFNPKYDKEPVPQGPVAHVYGYLELNFIDENNTPVTIRKHAFGSKPIIGGQNEQKDIFKSAMTDAIKKAASMIGIGLQLWRDDSEQDFFEDINYEDPWTEEEKNKHKKDFEYIDSLGFEEKELSEILDDMFGITDLNLLLPDEITQLVDRLKKVS